MQTQAEFIREQLERRQGERQLPQVAKGAGVALRSLYNVLQGAELRSGTSDALFKYLKQNVRKKHLTGEESNAVQ